jgi:magnesium-transporting ATPase (P-type)
MQVKMITGDHRVTAAAIAAELGLVGEPTRAASSTA